MALEILQIKSDLSNNFSYLVYCPTTRAGMVVDPSSAADKILKMIKELKLDIPYLVNTHGHGDHTAGNQAIIKETGARLAANPLEGLKAAISLNDGSTLPLGTGKIHIMHTPGHTPGSICLFIPPGELITGDTLFVTKVGRADLQGGNPEDLYVSLQRLASAPPETKVYPGHDYGPQPVSTIAFEKEYNPYLKCHSLEEFIRLRMG